MLLICKSLRMCINIDIYYVCMHTTLSIRLMTTVTTTKNQQQQQKLNRCALKKKWTQHVIYEQIKVMEFGSKPTSTCFDSIQWQTMKCQTSKIKSAIVYIPARKYVDRLECVRFVYLLHFRNTNRCHSDKRSGTISKNKNNKICHFYRRYLQA